MKPSTIFQITGLPIDSFRHLFLMNDDELATHNARRYIADSRPGFPCRVSLQDAAIGERVILLPYTHHAIKGPYNSAGPIFVRENAQPAQLEVNELPEVVCHRLMSIRAYGAEGLMLESQVTEGRDLVLEIERLFGDGRIAYLHLHNAKPGCYSCRVDRA